MLRGEEGLQTKLNLISTPPRTLHGANTLLSSPTLRCQNKRKAVKKKTHICMYVVHKIIYTTTISAISVHQKVRRTLWSIQIFGKVLIFLINFIFANQFELRLIFGTRLHRTIENSNF